MREIVLPDECNYIGAFLTLRCNLKCPYCINKFSKFKMPREMSAKDWIEGLSRIPTRADLPITLCGGEPTIHPGFYLIAHALRFNHVKYLDLLTNGEFDIQEFAKKIPATTFKRFAKYASIRISYHLKSHPELLVAKVSGLKEWGYEVGVWGLDINKKQNKVMEKYCKTFNIDFRVKEFLSKKSGTYKYPGALSGKKKTVLCKTSELLIGPSGHIFRCHADLYAFRNPVAHILDEEIKLPGFTECGNFGGCNPCDIKTKFDRFQKSGHCAVTIKEIE
jgi:organic radical activating enzyme